jgi:hypothetical protein
LNPDPEDHISQVARIKVMSYQQPAKTLFTETLFEFHPLLQLNFFITCIQVVLLLMNKLEQYEMLFTKE